MVRVWYAILMIDREIRYKGFFAFASNSISTAREALAVYRGRDCVDNTFSNFQTELDLCSTGVHHDATLRGKLLICLIALTSWRSSPMKWKMRRPWVIKSSPAFINTSLSIPYFTKS